MIDDRAYDKKLTASLQRLRRWYCEAALPLWAENGYDRSRGGFFEALNFDATPSIARPRRVRSQARQIHAFSQASLRGWSTKANTLASEGFDYFIERACPDQGARGCVHLLDDHGEILDDRRDLYDQAFLLLACASRWSAGKDQRARDLAARTVEFLDRELSSPHGGWFESDRRELPRRQNPHMHLFEAFMALYEATSEERYFEHANDIYDRCFRTFYNAADGIIVEHLLEDFSRDANARTIEPGHMFEWVWLLSAYERLTGADCSSARNTLYARGASLGEDARFFGFVSNSIDLDRPRQHGSKRLWPQTEYLRASLVQHESGDAKSGARAGSLIEGLFKSYLETSIEGLWIDEFDELGAPIAQDVPSSILYHLHEAVAAADRFLQPGKVL